MNLHRSVLAAALAAAIVTPGLAWGAGYGIFEQGAAALGMAGAHTASVSDPSAVFFNPAAIVRLDGHQISVGDTWLSTRTSFAGIDPAPGFGVQEEMNPGNFFPPTVYWTNRLSKKWAYGVGVNAPFGLGVDWKNPDTFTGRSRVTKATLRTINASLCASYAVNDQWSLGAGFDALFAGVELNNVTLALVPGGGGGQVNVAHVNLKGGYTPNYTWNAGALWTPEPEWKFGLNYRARVHVKIDDGDATFTQILTGNTAFDNAAAAQIPPNQKATAWLMFPSILSIGAAWNPTPDWTWEVDANQTKWSFFDELPLSFSKSPEKSTAIPEDYNDSWRFNFGAEHRLPNWTYRFGYYFDQEAAPSESVTPLLPDANRHGVTVGIGKPFGKNKAWQLDAYNLALFVEDRSTNGAERDGYNGTYKSYVNGFGASLGYHW